MTFLAPFFLSLAVLAGVPLLVHLLRRRITRRVDFPAVRFLLQANREHDRERTVRNRLLLLLRLLAVLALVAAVARPVARLGGTGHPPIALAIVLDQSGSTRAVVDGQPVFSALQATAREVLDALTPDDRVWLVSSDGAVTAGEAATVRSAIDAITPGDGRGDLHAALRRAITLARAGQPRTPVVLVLTDGQRTALPSAPATLSAEDVAIVVHAPTSAPPANRAVLRAEPEPARWTPAGQIGITLDAPTGTAWRALLGSRTLARGTMTDASARFVAAAQAVDTGWLAGRVELDADDFPVDDLRHFVVRAAPPPAVQVRRSAGPFVGAAITTLVDEGRLRTAAPDDRQTIVITDAAEGSGRPAVWLAPSDPLQLVAANRALERASIPWRFGALVRDTVAIRFAATEGAPAGWVSSQRYRLSTVASGAPAGGEGATSPDGARRGADAGRVLASAGGAPWLVVGDGWVIVASPLVPSAVNAPLTASFLPWLRDLLVQQLGRDGVIVPATPGAAVTLPLSVDAVLDADGGVRDDALRGGLGVAVTAPSRAGVYWLRRAERTVGALVVNTEVEESSVDGWGTAVWQGGWTGGRVELAPDAARVVRAVFERAGGRSIVWPLVLVALVALVLEALLARGVGAGRELTTAAAGR